MKHYLSNDEDWDVTFETFSPKEMTTLIIQYLKDNPKEMVIHRKDFPEHLRKKYYGKEIIDMYEVNPKTGEPSKIITKGNKNYYKKLTL